MCYLPGRGVVGPVERRSAPTEGSPVMHREWHLVTAVNGVKLVSHWISQRRNKWSRNTF